MSLASLSDQALVGRCREGDPDAWRELVARFSRLVHGIAVRAYRLEHHDAEDVFQEVFARTYEHLDELRDARAIRAWIAQLTRRLAIDRLRARSREHLAEDPLAEGVDDAALAALDEALTVREALERLPEPCRQVLDQFFAEDRSYNSISAQLGIPEGTIASRISRCLEKLRLALEGREAGVAASSLSSEPWPRHEHIG